LLICPAAGGADVSVWLTDTDSGLTSPAGSYRWLDVADQAFSAAYQSSYNYTQATVQVGCQTDGGLLRGRLTALNLKPNFAYQLKLAGTAGTATNERLGLVGRWWQEEWSGSAWVNGWNLNDKGDGVSPSPNDDAYFARRDMVDATSPTGKHYRYTAYLVLDYFVTDSLGNAVVDFEANSSYHVLWTTAQRTHEANDGPLRTATFDPSPAVHPAYAQDYGSRTVTVFGEWERLPTGGVYLPPGDYTCQVILTEESFHGSGGALAGGWAAAMGADVQFTLLPRAEHSFTRAGWTLTSVPLEPVDPAATAVFAGLPNPPVVYGWAAGHYVWQPDIHRGPGYWLLVSPAGGTANLSGSEATGATAYPCAAGWGIVGSGRTTGQTPLGYCQVRRFSETKNWETAAAAGWVADLAYTWDDAGQAYVLHKPASACTLAAWQGTWVLALVDGLTLLTPAGKARPSRTTRAPVSGVATMESWSVTLEASSRAGTDSVALQVHPDATDGFDGYLRDTPKPPPAPTGVTLEILHPDWRTGTPTGETRFQTDARAPVSASPAVWNLQVHAAQANGGLEVVLTTPDLTHLPNHLTATLVDLETRKTQYLRTTRSYQFVLSGEVPRRFQLVVEPRSTGALRIGALAAVPTRGGSLTLQYTLNKPATVQAQVRSASGRVVGTSGTGQTGGAGVNTLVWRGRLATQALPRGMYTVELTARTDEGQAAKQVTTLRLN